MIWKVSFGKQHLLEDTGETCSSAASSEKNGKTQNTDKKSLKIALDSCACIEILSSLFSFLCSLPYSALLYSLLHSPAKSRLFVKQFKYQ